MLPGYSPVTQAILGTLFTWFLTAAGSAMVFVFQSGKRRVLDGSLGFAAGVMLAASYWSLLSPAIEMSEEGYGNHKYLPAAIGFTAGACFVYFADHMLDRFGLSKNFIASFAGNPKRASYNDTSDMSDDVSVDMEMEEGTSKVKRRSKRTHSNNYDDIEIGEQNTNDAKQVSWRRIILLIVAITIHNIPEGLAVGVGFGAIGKSKLATYENAVSLAIGVGIQNFPEGLAVSLPLRGAGVSVWKSFFYGQLSGMVEPIAGILGAAAVVVAEPILPYALAFAAGAMVYVVNDDILPEAHTRGNGKLASAMSIVGFIVMMVLDVGLG